MRSLDRNSLCWDDFRLSPETQFEELSDFDCGDEDLNDFVINEAESYFQQMLAVTYSLRYVEGDKASPPLAFISFCNDSIRFKRNKQHRVIPNPKRRAEYPAVKIARLGVSGILKRQGMGTRLLDMAKWLFTNENRTGCRFLTVDAYNKTDVLGFYISNDFDFVHEDDNSDKTRIMYVDLKRPSL